MLFSEVVLVIVVVVVVVVMVMTVSPVVVVVMALSPVVVVVMTVSPVVAMTFSPVLLFPWGRVTVPPSSLVMAATMMLIRSMSMGLTFPTSFMVGMMFSFHVSCRC